MHSLSRTTWSRKCVARVLDMAKPKNKRVPSSMECVEEMLQESRVSRWTFYRYSRWISQTQFIVNHKPQSDGQNKSAKSWTKFQKKTIHIFSLQRKRKDSKDSGFLPWTKQAKMGLWNFDQIFEPQSWWRVVYTTNQGNKLKSLSIKINKDDGIHLQAHRGGTSLNGIGSELTIVLIAWIFLLQLFSFTVDSDPL